MTRELLERARTAGAAGVGVCSVEPFAVVASTMLARKATGAAGSLGFTYHDPGIATDVRRSFPWARRMVVVAAAYVPQAGSPQPTAAGEGVVARFAVEDHYTALREILTGLVDTLRRSGHRAEPLSDDRRLVDRAAAVRAGVGWWGKSTMVLVPGAGPWVLLGSVATDALLETTPPMERDCGTCTACLPACPTGALTAPGVLDARRCLAYWAQTRGVIPRDLRRAMGSRIYGCDACLDVCPPGHPLLRLATERRGCVDLEAALAQDDASLLARFTHFYVPGRRARYLRRNLLVALGNGGNGRSLPTLAGYAGHPDWLLRVHAVWALDAALGVAARHVLRAAAAEETHPEVRRELAHLGHAGLSG
jgi:epoxyqueuosine reductase